MNLNLDFKKVNPPNTLIEIVEKIRNCNENKNYGWGIFIDLKKAFDTVNHDVLLLKLEHYGIRGTALSWFKSYLSGRSQYVFCNNTSSDVKKTTCGVPGISPWTSFIFTLHE